MTVPFLAAEISGLAEPTYASGAANKAYVDTISGALDARIDALAGATAVTFGTLTATADGGITPFPAGSFGVSSQSGTALGLSVAGYSTISSQAQYAFNEIGLSGTKYNAAYLWYSASASKLSESGTKYTNAYAWYNASASTLGDLAASGIKYTSAYAWYTQSANKLSFTTGWADVPATITHGLGTIPRHISISPSGTVTFGWVINDITTTQFDVDITAAGSRTISWRAQV